MIKKLITVLLFSFSFAFAAAATRDGIWLNNALQANDRLTARMATDSETMDAFNLLGFISGILDSQSSNSTETMILLYALKDVNDEKAKAIKSVSLIYSPLVNMPSGIDGQQIVAIIRNFLQANPKRWKESAYKLVIDALKDAYPAPSLK